MQYNFSKTFLTLVVLFCSACQMTPSFTSSPPVPVSSRDDSVMSASTRQALWNKIQSKTPYKGPIQLRLDPALLGEQKTSQSYELTHVLDSSLFHTQSVPNGPVVFQETFVASGQADEFRRSFQITDNSPRYIVHVQRLGQLSQTDVYLNGNQTLASQNFNQTLEAQSPGTLLNQNNALLLRYQGEPGASVTVTIVQAGQAGTILRHQGGLGLPDETQATHVNQSDSALFNPNVPDSLGGLKPYEGDLEVPAYGASPAIRISAMKFNDLRPLKFESGVLILKFVNPQIGLELMHNHYGAEVVDELEGFYTLRLNLDAAPVNEIIDLIHNFNEHSDGNVESVVFSSLASMQTYAIGLDLLKRFPGMLTSFDFNEIGEPATVFNDSVLIHTHTQYPLHAGDVDYGIDVDISDCSANPINSWWLTQTHVDRAWDLSIGTGVKVAWLDMGYTFPQTVDIESRRLKFGLGSLNVNESHTSPVAEPSYNPSLYHSLYAILTGFAERDNQTGTVGVAPNAIVVPYRMNVTSTGFAYAVKQARENNIPIIGINYGWQKSNPSSFFYYTLNEILSFGGESSLKSQVIQALREHRSVIMAAHNYYESIENWQLIDLTVGKQSDPSDYNQELADGLIVVGSVMPFKPTDVSELNCPSPGAGQLQLYAHHRTDPDLVGKNGWGSDYGENMVWAPGDQIYLQNNFITNAHQSVFDHFGGTSAATPFVTAVVAQMRSRNPALTPKQIKDILLASHAQRIVPHPRMVIDHISPAYLLDVEKALSDPLVWSYFPGSPGNNTVPRKATAFYGLIMPDHKIKLNASILSSALADQKEKQLLQTVSQPVWDNTLKLGNVVKLTGWTFIQAGDTFYDPSKLETLQAETVCDIKNCISATIPSSLKPTLRDIGFEALTNSTPTGFTPESAKGFQIVFNGDNLIPNLRDEASAARFVVKYQLLDPATGDPAINPSTGLPETEKSIPFSDTNIVDVSNDGKQVKLKIPPYNAATGEGLAPGNYAFSLGGLGQVMTDPLKGASKGYSVLDESSANGGGYGILSIQSDPPPLTPHITLWMLRDGQRLPVPQNGIVGVAINDQDLNQLVVEVVQGDQHLAANVVEVAQNFAAFRIPDEAQPGVHDLLLRIGADQALLHDAVDVRPSGPVSVMYDKRDIFTNGNDWATMTIKVKHDDGTPYPDGYPFYVIPYTQLVTHMDGSPLADHFATSENSEIKLKVASQQHISVGEYANNDWPAPGNPAIQPPIVCEATYYNGYRCNRQLAVTETQPDLYLKDVYRIDFNQNPMIVYAMGGPIHFTGQVFDRAGLPVPDGTVLRIEQSLGTFGSWSTGNNITMATSQNKIDIQYTPIQIPCWGASNPNGGLGDGDALHFFVGDYFTKLEPYFTYAYTQYAEPPGCS